MENIILLDDGTVQKVFCGTNKRSKSMDEVKQMISDKPR
jgi:hypothetical protein